LTRRADIKIWNKCKKRLKIESKRVFKAENLIEGKWFSFLFFSKGDQPNLPKNRTNNVFNKMVQSYRVFILGREFYTEKSIWKNGSPGGCSTKIRK
jgi:hypothetical protein